VPGDVTLAFEGHAVTDGDTFAVGALEVSVVHTPGHTPHHVSYAVRRGNHPGVVFTGGSMLYGAVGRPDLVAPELTVRQSHDQWHSVRRLAAHLDDETRVYPTHGFGSFCAATQQEGTSGTVADERAHNPALTQDEEAFVTEMLANLDVFPAYYAHMGPTNAAGPAPIDLTLPAAAEPAELRRRIAAGEWVVDLRSREVFARGHVPGTLSYDLDGAFVAYVSWMIPAGAPVTLLGETTEQVAAAQRELARIGIDRPAAQAVGGPRFWLDGTDERPMTVRRLDFRGLAAALVDEPDAVVLDTRQVLEWEAGHVAGARFLPFYEVEARLAEVPRDRTVFVYCGSGYRAAAVTSLLLRAGFRDVVHIDDQFSNAAAAGLTIVAEPAAAREPGWTWTASRACVRPYQPRTTPVG
jgi:rhodanese-related sulfurtransferase